MFFRIVAAVRPSDPSSFRPTVRSVGTNPRWLSIWPLSPKLTTLTKLHPFDKGNPTAPNGAHTALPSLGGGARGDELPWVPSLGELPWVPQGGAGDLEIQVTGLLTERMIF